MSAFYQTLSSLPSLFAHALSRHPSAMPPRDLWNRPLPHLSHSPISVYLSLWFALVSRSQVSLINFVASLCGAGGIQAFKTMRTLRALRPLRAMSRMQGMRVCSPPSQQTLSLAPRPPWTTAESITPSATRHPYVFVRSTFRRFVGATPRWLRVNVTVPLDSPRCLSRIESDEFSLAHVVQSELWFCGD